MRDTDHVRTPQDHATRDRTPRKRRRHGGGAPDRRIARAAYNPEFPIWTSSYTTCRRGAERADHPVAHLVHPFRHVDGRRPYRPQPRARARGHCEGPLQRHLRCLGPRLLIAPAPDVGLSITWGAARVARCAGESAERDFPSSTAAHGVRPDWWDQSLTRRTTSARVYLARSCPKALSQFSRW